MKRFDRLVIKSFLGPLLLTFVVSVFVLLMQFVWKYVDDIAGKGLSVGIIAELLLYASATFVPMAMPIALLFASIMTMGNMGEHYELVAAKSGGIPMWRVMMPMGIIVFFLMFVAFFFANNVMPSAVLKYRTTLYDVTRKKPAINIKPGEYYKEIDGFVIRVDKKEPDGCTLSNITIYDHRNNSSKPDIIVAKNGLMELSHDERFLLFTLYDGCSYSENTESHHNESYPFTRIFFTKNKMSFDLSGFAFDKSDETIFQGGYQMMNTSQLDSNIARLAEKHENDRQLQLESLQLYNKATAKDYVTDQKLSVNQLLDSLEKAQLRRVYGDAYARAERNLNDCKLQTQVFSSQKEYINRHYIEWHRKFTLSVACLVLFLVGAPFGSIVRKGGLGVPLVASVGFFVIYYVIGMIAEKAVREGAIGHWGMWISTLVMIPVGLILTYKAVQR